VVRVSRLACVYVSYFTAAAVVRCEPALAERPLAVVGAAGPAARVVEANAAAREHGIGPEMTEAQARARCPELVRRLFASATVASAQQALLTAALGVSPRVEDGGPGCVYVEIDGLRRLIGDDAAVGERLLRLARDVGLDARVGVAGSRIAAQVVARSATRVTVVPPGDDRVALAAAPLDRVDLPVEVVVALRRWGLTDLGALAALSRDALTARLGADGLLAHDLARGVDRRPFRAWTPPPFWEEVQGIDWEIHDLLALADVLELVLQRLSARLDAVHLAADVIEVRLGLLSGARHERSVALAHPSRDVGVMLALVRLDLERHPPPAAVVEVAIGVRPVVGHPGQSGLWQPAGPPERDLAALLARLVRLVGPDNVGSPVVDDSHRPDAITLAPFAPPAAESTPATTSDDVSLALRRLRPAAPIDVLVAAQRPIRVARGGAATRVLECAGPWRVSGEWWDTQGWAREEWDVLLDDGTLCRLAHESRSQRWLLDGVYD